jgi:hypothetical protein
MKVYIASKTKHAEWWRALRSAGLPVNSTWIDEADEGKTSDWSELWERCISEARQADVLIAYHEPGDEWKGAFVEIGAHLTRALPHVIVVGDPPGSWVNHPQVSYERTVSDAILDARLWAGE